MCRTYDWLSIPGSRPEQSWGWGGAPHPPRGAPGHAHHQRDPSRDSVTLSFGNHCPECD